MIWAYLVRQFVSFDLPVNGRDHIREPGRHRPDNPVIVGQQAPKKRLDLEWPCWPAASGMGSESA